MPMVEFCRMLASDTGVSIVVDQALDSIPITIEVQNQSVDDLLGVVARRAGVQVTKTGSLYFLGTLRREDRGILVRRVRRLSGEQLRQACATLQSDVGSAVVFEDGLTVVGDRVEILSRLHDLFDQLEACENPLWVVQLYVVSLSADDLSDLGIDATPAIDVSMAFAAGSASGAGSLLPGGLSASSHLNGGLDALLRIARRDDGESLVAERCLTLGDGVQGTMFRGEEIPIPNNSVNDQGKVITQGYKYKEAGVRVELLIRELDATKARLSGTVRMSSVSGYTESAPILITEEMNIDQPIVAGGGYLLRSMEQKRIIERNSTGLRWGRRSEAETRYLQLWAKASRVGGPAVGSEISLPAEVGSQNISLPPEGQAAPSDGLELLPPITE